ncbi:MAG: hypothetical protein HWE26_03260 [Alteromonadaceae bacterium]|nr:hypothetical protein [Alteromonadaceae bacterium]
MSDFHEPASGTSIGQHYSRIVAAEVVSKNNEELQRLLSSLVADELIVQAAIYTPAGERIGLQGDTRNIPILVRNTPQLQISMVEIYHQGDLVGYLQWLTRPNTD